MTDYLKSTNTFMKPSFCILLIVALISCTQENKEKSENVNITKEIRDTTLVKKKNALNASYEVGFYSKSFSYYWTVGKDTLDLIINVVEYEKDSSLHLNILHEKPILFRNVLDKINECISLIEVDFNITKFSSLYFRSPIYYLDLTKELSKEYEQSFGKNRISYQKLDEFLLESALNTQLNNFLKPFDKKVKRYSIEKFQLLDKKSFSEYLQLPVSELSDYPEFTIEGMGLSVQLVDK